MTGGCPVRQTFHRDGPGSPTDSAAPASLPGRLRTTPRASGDDEPTTTDVGSRSRGSDGGTASSGTVCRPWNGRVFPHRPTLPPTERPLRTGEGSYEVQRSRIGPPALHLELVDLRWPAGTIRVHDQPRAVAHVDVVEERDPSAVRGPDGAVPIADATIAVEESGALGAVGPDHPDLEREVPRFGPTDPGVVT